MKNVPYILSGFLLYIIIAMSVANRETHEELQTAVSMADDLQQRIEKMETELNKNSKIFKSLLETPQTIDLDDVDNEEQIANFIINFDKKFNYLTDKQIKNLIRAYEIGSEEGLGLAMMGVCMQETLCGETVYVGHMTADIGKRSYGLMQVKVAATRDVLEAYPHLGHPSMVDEEIIAKHLTNDDWNMKVSLHYLMILRDSGLTWREMLTAYNLGPAGAKRVANPSTYKYTESVLKHIEQKKFKTLVEEYAKS